MVVLSIEIGPILNAYKTRIFPTDQFLEIHSNFRYNWIIMSLTYFIPVVVIAATSGHMGYILWCKQPIGIITAPIERARQKKKKVCKVLICIEIKTIF